MSGTFDDIWPPSGGAGLQSYFTRVALSGGSVTFTRSARVRISALAGGGSGGIAAYSGSSTDYQYAAAGNTSPWGRKTIAVQTGDVLSWVVGAGGGPVTGPANGPGLPGLAGGDTIVYLNGVEIMRAQGGEGGTAGGTGSVVPTDAQLPALSAVVTGADIWRKGIAGGPLTNQSGGAVFLASGSAPDLLGNGLGRGSGYVSLGASIGGSVGVNTAMGYTPWAVLAEWGLLVTDTNAVNAPGKGGAVSVGGVFGGGSAAGAPVFGGGSSASWYRASGSAGTSFKGGDGYVYIECQLGSE